jgi:hypothetical protein
MSDGAVYWVPVGRTLAPCSSPVTLAGATDQTAGHRLAAAGLGNADLGCGRWHSIPASRVSGVAKGAVLIWRQILGAGDVLAGARLVAGDLAGTADLIAGDAVAMTGRADAHLGDVRHLLRLAELAEDVRAHVFGAGNGRQVLGSSPVVLTLRPTLVPVTTLPHRGFGDADLPWLIGGALQVLLALDVCDRWAWTCARRRRRCYCAARAPSAPTLARSASGLPDVPAPPRSCAIDPRPCREQTAPRAELATACDLSAWRQRGIGALATRRRLGVAETRRGGDAARLVATAGVCSCLRPPLHRSHSPCSRARRSRWP